MLGGALAGFAGDAGVFWQWASAGFGKLYPFEPSSCSRFLFLGVEVLFSSVFLSMLGISRDTYIGDTGSPPGNASLDRRW